MVVDYSQMVNYCSQIKVVSSQIEIVSSKIELESSEIDHQIPGAETLKKLPEI
jgi:hypothetical protein